MAETNPNKDDSTSAYLQDLLSDLPEDPFGLEWAHRRQHEHLRALAQQGYPPIDRNGNEIILSEPIVERDVEMNDIEMMSAPHFDLGIQSDDELDEAAWEPQEQGGIQEEGSPIMPSSLLESELESSPLSSRTKTPVDSSALPSPTEPDMASLSLSSPPSSKYVDAQQEEMDCGGEEPEVVAEETEMESEFISQTESEDDDDSGSEYVPESEVDSVTQQAEMERRDEHPEVESEDTEMESEIGTQTESEDEDTGSEYVQDSEADSVVDGFSDADPTQRPPPGVKAFPATADQRRRFVENLGKMWTQRMKGAHLGQPVDIPSGYQDLRIPRGNQSTKSEDLYLYGHPTGYRYRSVNKFYPHWEYLVRKNEGEDVECRCKGCETWSKRR